MIRKLLGRLLAYKSPAQYRLITTNGREEKAPLRTILGAEHTSKFWRRIRLTTSKLTKYGKPLHHFLLKQQLLPRTSKEVCCVGVSH